MPTTCFKEDQELDAIREQERMLLQRHRQVAELPDRLEREQRERECTMPPLAEIQDRRRMKEHEDTLTRREVGNILRAQSRSAVLVVMLIAATGALIWWGLKLMQA